MSIALTERINLGCGRFPLDGYLNVDMHEGIADELANVWELHFSEVQEVRADHFLEHFGHRETVPLLEHIRGWMAKGALLLVEVPDIEAIMRMGMRNHDWLRYLYGSQQHSGEFHKTGFTDESLRMSLIGAGFVPRYVNKTRSEFRTRVGMPCLEAAATA